MAGEVKEIDWQGIAEQLHQALRNYPCRPLSVHKDAGECKHCAAVARYLSAKVAQQRAGGGSQLSNNERAFFGER